MKPTNSIKNFSMCFCASLLALCLACPAALAANPSTGSEQAKPNILLIMSDDVGITNISAYSDGLVGCKKRRLTLT